MSRLDTDLIQRHEHLARAFLANDPDVDAQAGHDAVLALAEDDVPAMLLALEEAAVASDAGYVRGLRAAAAWLRTWDQPLPGFDRDTCRNLARGMQAMAVSAQRRLGVDPDQADDHDQQAGNAAALQGVGR